MTGALSGLMAFDLPRQVVFSGVVNGMTYGVTAVGIILIYRSTRVINFAIAAMGGVGAALLARMVINWNFNFWVAFAVCVVLGGVLGAVMDLLVIRRLFEAPRVIVLVATIGAAQLFLFAQAVLPQPKFITSYPTPFEHVWVVANVRVRSEHVLILVIVPLMTIALAFFLNRTKYGIAVRASAANPDAARLAAVNVRRMSTVVWATAGVLATIGTILSAPITTSSSTGVFDLGPGLLLRVLVAALIGRMVSPGMALVGGVAIGVGEALLFYNLPSQHGVLDLALFVVVLVTLIPLARTSGAAGTDPHASWSFAPRVRPIPTELRDVWWVKRLPQIGALITIGLGVVPLILVSKASQQQLWSRMLLYTIVALSLTVLTGWAGQLSLGQFAFAGLGAMTTASLVHEGVGFFPAVIAAAVIGGLAALIVGAPVLRIPGLFLAVATFAFVVASASWLFSRSIFLHGDPSVTMPRAIIGSFSLAPERTYYTLCLVVLMVVILALSCVRRSGYGRSMIAVRDNERAAASVGLSPSRVKLTAFGISGTLAGLAGGLLAGVFVTFGPERFTATESLQVIAIAVIGGLASIPGTVLGALWVVGLPAAFSNSPKISLLTSGAGLLLLLLFLPGGLVQVLYAARDMLLARASRRLPAREAVDPDGEVARPSVLVAPARAVADDGPVMRVQDLTVRFGGRVAVDGVDLVLGRGEVVGLIGSNGAGKSTVMNAIGGFVGSTGSIEVLGRDVRALSPARRARLGLARSFQGAELFGDLTVRETVAIALEAEMHASLASVVLGLPGARRVERAKRNQADEVVAFLGLGRFADRFVNELSTGTRRIVEVACLIASGARVLCLDEPTAGLAQRESENFGPLILDVRREIDASLLVIEHDMAVVMGISDRVYCMESGSVICSGSPNDVRADPRVIAAYLGTPQTETTPR